MSNAESFQNGSRHFSDSVAIIEGDILLSKEQTETIMTRSGAITDVKNIGQVIYIRTRFFFTIKC